MIADDDIATTYKVQTSDEIDVPLLQLGDGWNDVEESQGKPFRWIKGNEADMCVFGP